MLGTAFIAGVGAAADTARATLENIPRKLEDDLKEMGVLYNAQNEKFNQSLKVAEANIANIERIASDFGIEAGIVNSVYAANGGDESKTREQLKNMIDTYGDQPIPTSPIEPTKSTTLSQQMQVEAAPKEAVSKNMFQDFAKLFRYYGPDQVLQEFAKKQNISVDRAQKILSGTFGDLIPEAQYDVKPAPEAMLASMEKPKDVPGFLDTGTKTRAIYDRLVSLSDFAMKNPEKYTETDRKIINQLVPQFLASEGDDFQQELIVKMAQDITSQVETKDAKTEPQFEGLLNDARNLILNAKPGLYDKTAMKNLSEAIFSESLDFNDIRSKYDIARESIKEAAKEENPKEFETRKDTVANYLLQMREFLLKHGSNATAKANELANQMYKDAFTTVVIQGRTYQYFPSADGSLKAVEVGQTDASGQLFAGSPDDREEFKKNKQTAIKSLGSIYQMMNTLTLDPNAFNFIRQVKFAASDLRDITFGVTGKDPAKIFKFLKQPATTIAALQTAETNAIGLIASAKNELFKDPRLSDQDLRLVKQYIAVIDNNFIGSTRAMAALVKLERIFATNIAINIAAMYGPQATAVIYNGDEIDLTQKSIAQEVVLGMAQQKGVLKSGQSFEDKAKAFSKEKSRIDKMVDGAEKTKELENYQRKIETYGTELDALQKIVQRAIPAISMFKENPDYYKENWRSSSTMDLTEEEQKYYDENESRNWI